MPIPSLTASSHLPIPCGLTGMFPCGKGKGRSKTRSSYWEPRHRSWLPPSDDWLSITDSMALFQEIWWLCHRRIFNNLLKHGNNLVYERLQQSSRIEIFVLIFYYIIIFSVASLYFIVISILSLICFISLKSNSIFLPLIKNVFVS